MGRPIAGQCPDRVVTSSPLRISRSSTACWPHCSCALDVLWSVETMKSSPAARASATSCSGVRRPSEWTVWRWLSPRYQARPFSRAGAVSGAGFGLNGMPSGPKVSVMSTW